MEKFIEGFENYKITTEGKVLSKHYGKLRVLSSVPDKFGYRCVGLYNHGTKKTVKIHRLVATAFIPNPENKPQVNHIDRNPTNNNVENLEWVTSLENNLHSRRLFKRRVNRQIGSENVSSKETIQVSLDGFVVGVYSARMEAQRATGILNSDISQAILRKRLKTAGGYYWY